MESINEVICWHGTGRISNCLKRLLHVVLGCVPAIILTIFFLSSVDLPLLVELPHFMICVIKNLCQSLSIHFHGNFQSKKSWNELQCENAEAFGVARHYNTLLPESAQGISTICLGTLHHSECIWQRRKALTLSVQIKPKHHWTLVTDVHCCSLYFPCLVD